MTRHPYSVSIATCIFLVVMHVAGCTPPAPSGPDYPDGVLDLSDANNQSLSQIADRFLSLAETGSLTDSASSLVAELQAGYPGVSSATLGSDGCTIFLQMTDGSVALINTNRTVFGSGDSTAVAENPSSARTILTTGLKDIRRASARMLPTSFTCPNLVMPQTRNVLIINAAAVSNPSTNDYVLQLQDALIAQGWSSSEIEVRTRDGDGDSEFTPISMIAAEGYGIVFVIAQGCVANVSGVPYGYLQCCRPRCGATTLYGDLLAEVLGERDSGRLIRCQTPAEGGGFVSDIYIRNDCLREKMRVTEGAMVHFIAPHSWSVAEGLAGQGAGGTLGWEGAFQGTDGLRAVLGMISRMTADHTWTTDTQAYANLMLSGLGLSVDPAGRASQARIAGTEGDFYMPAWGVFTVDMDEMPDDAVDVQVEMTYASCPDFKFSFSMTVTDSVETLRLPAGEATIAVKALNIAGKVVGTGLYKVPLNGGRNDIQLMTCKAKVNLYLREYPASGVNALSRLRVEFTYADALLDPPLPAEISLSGVAGWSADLWAGKVSVRCTALNAAGAVVGEHVEDEDIECGSNTVDVCFGWAKLEATRYPPDTKSIRVVSDNANAPGPFTLTPGGTAEAYGFRVDGLVHFTAEALDSSGDVIASKGETVSIACGENTVSFDLLNYGITVSADPDTIAADGTEQSTITATLRYWQTGDTTTPTGKPLVGKSVLFSTTHGTLSGTNPAVSDASGTVSIKLSGTADGLATVVAYVAEDVKEGKCLVQIGGTGVGYSLSLVYTGQRQEASEFVGSLRSLVRDAKDKRVAGCPVRFRLVSGTVQLDEPLDRITDEEGVVEITVRSGGPAIGLVEATVPGTLLIKKCIAYLQTTYDMAPTHATTEIDNGEVLLTINMAPDPGMLGLPYQWAWPQYPRKGRPIRGGTKGVDGHAAVDWIEGTSNARLYHGAEPDTTIEIYPKLYFTIDGEMHPLGGSGPQPSCEVSFFQNVIATLPVSVESRSRVRPDNPSLYEAKVVARFVGGSCSDNIRFIVHNPDDHGEYSGEWYDGSNRVAKNLCSQISIVIAHETYLKTEPPDSWIASKLSSYQKAFGNLSASVSKYPEPVIGSNVPQSYDPWEGW